MKLTVSEDVEVVLNGEKILLEKGDVIVVESFQDEMLGIEMDIKTFYAKYRQKGGVPRIDNFMRWVDSTYPNYIDTLFEQSDADKNKKIFVGVCRRVLNLA